MLYNINVNYFYIKRHPFYLEMSINYLLYTADALVAHERLHGSAVTVSASVMLLFELQHLCVSKSWKLVEINLTTLF